MSEQQIDTSKIYYCHNCLNAEEVPGDCHITCTKPLRVQGRVENGSDITRFAVQQALAKTMKEHPESLKCVIRCVWGGSGFFPLLFDSNTVIACANFEPILNRSKE